MTDNHIKQWPKDVDWSIKRSLHLKLEASLVELAEPQHAGKCVVAIRVQQKGGSGVVVKEGRVIFNIGGYRLDHHLCAAGRLFIQEFDATLDRPDLREKLIEKLKKEPLEFTLDSRQQKPPEKVILNPKKGSNKPRPRKNFYTRENRGRCSVTRRNHATGESEIK